MPFTRAASRTLPAPGIALALVLAISCPFFISTALASQPTWGKPKVDKPAKPAQPTGEPGDDEDHPVADPDAPMGSGQPGDDGEGGAGGGEGRVADAGRWSDDDPEKKQPTYECDGGVWYAAKTAAGARFLWSMPVNFEKGKSYDIIVLMHPRGENVRWGMNAHAEDDPLTGGRFRPNDILISVDGPSMAGGGRGRSASPRSNDRRDFVPGQATIVAFRDTILEFTRSFPMRHIYLDANGSSADFAAVFAARFPALADGMVLYRAGNVAKAAAGKGRSPIVFLHGAKDSLQSVGTSIDAHRAFMDAGHAGARLRILPSYNDYPNPFRVSECLDWIAAMNADDPAEVLDRARAMLTPKDPDEYGYTAPVWFAGANEALARITGAGLLPPTAADSPWKKLENISDETVAAASALQSAINAHAQRHVEALKALDDAKSAATIAPDGSAVPNWLWLARHDFRTVPAMEDFAKAIDYDRALDAHAAAATVFALGWSEAGSEVEKTAVAAEWARRIFLAPTLPLNLGTIARIAEKQHAAELDEETTESIELIRNVDQSWTEGAKAYAKLWHEWTLDSGE